MTGADQKQLVLFSKNPTNLDLRETKLTRFSRDQPWLPSKGLQRKADLEVNLN